MDCLPSPPLLPSASNHRAASASLPPRLASARRIGRDRGEAQCRAEKEASGAAGGVDSGSEEEGEGAVMRWQCVDQEQEQAQAQAHDTDTDDGSGAERGKRRERRTFSKGVREECWKQAAMVEGRSGERWRRDVLGNIVFQPLLGCSGPLCFDFDHVVPFAKGGTSSIHNCQVLQVAVNRAKGSAVSNSWRHDAQQLTIHQPSGEDMDVLELAAYGDMWHGSTRHMLRSPACDRLHHSPGTSAPAGRGHGELGKARGSTSGASGGAGSGCTLQ